MADRFPLIIDNSAEKIKELVSGDNLDLTKSNLKNADHIQSAGVNVAGVATATSLIGDGSQLTNLPPSGGTFEATASGTLADGSKVIVNADGTVSVVTQTETLGPGAGAEVVFESANSYWTSAVYDSSNNKVVIAYRDTGNTHGTAVVGTVSGTGISFGTPVVFNAAGTSYTAAVYDSTNNKVVIAYRDDGNSSYGTAIVGTVSGTSISFGSSAVFETFNAEDISATYDSTNSKVVIAYNAQGNSGAGTAVIGTVSGTSISFGSSTVFESGSSRMITPIHDSTNNKVVIAYNDEGNNSYGTAAVGTVSGTSISFGTPVVFNSSNSDDLSAVYDPSSQKVVIVYRDQGNSYRSSAIVGTVSGTSISFGTPVVFNYTSASAIAPVYDPDTQKIFIIYRDGSNSNYGTALLATVSGTSISFGPSTVFNTANTFYISATYDSTNDKVVISYADYGNSGYGTAVVLDTTGSGDLPELGSTTIFDSTVTYYPESVYDPDNQKVIIAYSDGSNSFYGTAVVGTVSGNSISFGTPVVFYSGSTFVSTRDISIAYDSANQKVVITYIDGGSQQDGTAIVGTVSGTSISFGSPSTYNGTYTSWPSIVYDSANQKVVIAYGDGGNSWYGTAVVGTVSGTSISFGSEVVFESGYTTRSQAVYDPDNQKIVIAYRDEGNSNYGTAVVGTVSGTSISFGSPVVFESANVTNNSIAYDSTNDKVVIAYNDDGNSGYGTAIVGTVSGTSISFGNPVVFHNTNTYYTSAVYDPINQRVVIAYREHVNPFLGRVIAGTVSGTTISFGSSVILSYSNTGYLSAIYDSTNEKVIITYSDITNSYQGEAVTYSPRTISTNLTIENYIGISDGAYTNGQTATIQIMGAVDDAQSSLTPGQAYYVQDDGTLAESGSVFAGTAVAATKLIVRG